MSEVNQLQADKTIGALSPPNILSPNFYNDTLSVEIETVILDTGSFSFVKDGSSTARWELPKKAVLNKNCDLVFNLKWLGTNDNTAGVGTGRRACLAKQGGGLACIKRCRLSAGGKLLQSVEKAGEYIYLKSYCYQPYEHRRAVSDLFNGGNSAYSIDVYGEEAWDEERRDRGDLVNGVEILVRLQDLFPMLNDVEIPTGLLNQHLLVEVDFETAFANVFTEIGSTGWNADNRNFEITRPRLLLDYIHYPIPVMENLQSLYQGGGEEINFRDMVLVKKSHAGGTTTHDVGMAQELVSKIYIQKLDSTKNERISLCHGMRSDYRAGESYNFQINNRQVYPRDIDNVAEKYSYLSQTNPRPFRSLMGMYETDGTDATTGNNFMRSTANFGGFGVNIQNDQIADAFQGSQQYIGINLGSYRADDDSPLNATKVQNSPIIVRYTATDACELNYYIEKAKKLSIRGGEVGVVG